MECRTNRSRDSEFDVLNPQRDGERTRWILEFQRESERCHRKIGGICSRILHWKLDLSGECPATGRVCRCDSRQSRYRPDRIVRQLHYYRGINCYRKYRLLQLTLPNRLNGPQFGETRNHHSPRGNKGQDLFHRTNGRDL